jgi:hypothetical protein
MIRIPSRFGVEILEFFKIGALYGEKWALRPINQTS